jgi:hypothetical protein
MADVFQGKSARLLARPCIVKLVQQPHSLTSSSRHRTQFTGRSDPPNAQESESAAVGKYSGILAFWQGWKTERRCRASWRQVASVFGTGSSLIGLVQGMVPSSKPAALHFPLPPLPPPTNPHPPTITLLISAKLVKDIRMFETKLEYFSGSDRY